ncbi:MAG TPA: hypothetical protein VKZ96_12900 [Thermomicrobiales bacterium]|nr:hypothetical protein [Thermomicrobiales bacterium]
MAASTTMTPRSATTSDLKAAGFTTAEVARLVEARACYTPYRELFSKREFQRLSFLRWEVEQGRLEP